MKYSSHKGTVTKSMPGVFDIRATTVGELEVAWGIAQEEVEEEWDPGHVMWCFFAMNDSAIHVVLVLLISGPDA
jgi:hypothetical protein